MRNSQDKHLPLISQYMYTLLEYTNGSSNPLRFNTLAKQFNQIEVALYATVPSICIWVYTINNHDFFISGNDLIQFFSINCFVRKKLFGTLAFMQINREYKRIIMKLASIYTNSIKTISENKSVPELDVRESRNKRNKEVAELLKSNSLNRISSSRFLDKDEIELALHIIKKLEDDALYEPGETVSITIQSINSRLMLGDTLDLQ